MTLARMMEIDRDALVCDLAEVYGILDYKALPVPLLAALASGLRDNSRIKMKMNGQQIPVDTMLLAALVDQMAMSVWMWSENSKKGRDRPRPVLALLTGQETQEEESPGFATPEEYERKRAEIIKGGRHGN